MKRARICWKCLRSALSRIHLVDKCLILFMLVLLLQSAYSLFFLSGPTAESSDIDIIVRTSSAAIFGYFLSANFIHHSTTARTAQNPAGLPALESGNGAPLQSDGPRSQIGFAAPGPSPEAAHGKAAVLPTQAQAEEPEANRLQVIAAAGIGLFCLLALLLLRDTSQMAPAGAASASLTATVAQFRDFVSGCVGFLIGCPSRASQAKT